jgi:hypothetical protein
MTGSRFKVEGSNGDPTERDDGVREEIADYQVKAAALRYVREFHSRGLWVEVFSVESKELLAGPFDPDEPLPKIFIGA